MKTKIHVMTKGILLVPDSSYGSGVLHDDSTDPHGFLREGPFGARPPIAFRGPLCAYDHHRAWVTPSEYHRDCYMCGDYPDRGLVLRWEGKEVVEGLDRAGRVFVSHYMRLGGQGRIFPGRTINNLHLVARGMTSPAPCLLKWLLDEFDARLHWFEEGGDSGELEAVLEVKWVK